MKEMNGQKQMTDVWHLPAIAPWEKTCTKHPTQKPLALLTRTEIEQLDIVSTYREKIFKQLSRQSNGYNYEPLTDAMQLNDEVSDYNISALPF